MTTSQKRLAKVLHRVLQHPPAGRCMKTNAKWRKLSMQRFATPCNRLTLAQ
ncbi:MAG: hypothetical protein AAFV43_11740 [Planctomycetota bacterium]